MKKLFIFIVTVFTLLLNCPAQNNTPFWSLAGNSNATSASKFGTTNNRSLRFYTYNKQRMIINSDAGFVGIGTISPNVLLHVSSPSGVNPFRVQVGNGTKLFVHSGGGVSIGSNSTAPDNGLHVFGRVEVGTNTQLGGSLDVFATSVNTAVYARADSGNGVNGRSFWGTGVIGFSALGYGVVGECPEGTGVKASGQVYGLDATGDYSAVNCFSSDGFGVTATSTNATGVSAGSTNSYGGDFSSFNSTGLVAGTTNGTYAAEFRGKVFASGGFITSDKNLKQNVHEFTNAMAIINKLKPQNYEFKQEPKYQSLHLPQGTHYGLMAQDLEVVLPNLVSEGKHELITREPIFSKATAARNGSPAIADKQEIKTSITIKAVNYVELIPIMIKGMQEQQADNEKLKTIIAGLQSELNDLKALVVKSLDGKPVTSSPGYLQQNVPNPAKNNTTVGYHLPGNTASAQISITDVNGNRVKLYNAAKGDGQINIKSGEIAAGRYNYTLYVNNKEVDSKQMIIIK